MASLCVPADKRGPAVSSKEGYFVRCEPMEVLRPVSRNDDEYGKAGSSFPAAVVSVSQKVSVAAICTKSVPGLRPVLLVKSPGKKWA